MSEKLLKTLLLPVLAATLLAGRVDSATTTITSLPYTASQAGANFSETLLVAGTNLVAGGSGLNVTGHDIVIYLLSDTITFGTGGGDFNYGIQLDGSSYNIRIIGGTIYHGGAGDHNNCLQLMGTNDVLIERTNMRIAGSNGHCLTTPSIGPPSNYNVEISGGHYRSDVTGYSNRCNYDGAAIVLGTTYQGYGDYHYKVHGLRLITGPGQGLIVSGRTGGNDALVFVYACTLQSDARNDFYTSGDNTCLSAANPYQIIGGYLAGGSEIHHNVITSGTTYGGSRGILLETCSGTPDNPVKVYNNYVDVHEGPNLEEATGLVQVLRMRFGNKYVHVYDNTFIGTGSLNDGSSYGAQVAVFRLTATNEEGHEPDHGNVIERNLFRALALSSGVEAQAGVFESFADVGNTYRHNRFESPGDIICFGETNYGADGVMLHADTLVRLSPSYSPRTVVVGWRNYYGASDDTLRDCIYIGGATENDIQFDASGSDYRLERTLSVTVHGNNGLPVPDASVTVVNNYGHTVLAGTTNGRGVLTGAVTYHWEQHTGTDSLDYNDFTVTAAKGSDNTVITVTIDATSPAPTLTLANTAGEEPTSDITPPDAINDVNAVPGANHGEITLSWTAPGDDGNVGTATGYDIRYSTSIITAAGWTRATQAEDPPPPSPAGNSESFTITGLDEGWLYYVAIKAYDEESNYADPSNVPNSFAAGIRSPTPVATTVDSANATAAATCATVSSYLPLAYEFELDTEITFPAPRTEAGSVGGATASATFSQLDVGVPYYWRCRAMATDYSDYSQWSWPRSFTLSQNSPPGQPRHASPATGDTTTADPIVLVVDNAGDPDGDVLTYNFWLSGDSLFTNVLDSVMNIPEGTTQTGAAFDRFSPQNGTKYWWRSQAGDGRDKGVKTTPTWFVWASLATGSECETPPSTPSLISPQDGSLVSSTLPTLCVSNSLPAPGCSDPQRYTFEIYYDAALTHPAISPRTIMEDIDSTCFAPNWPLPGGRDYWWRVRCSNGTAVSEWAGPFGFTTPNTAPAAPVVQAPVDGATVNTLSPALTVINSADADGDPLTYEFELYDQGGSARLGGATGIIEGATTTSWLLPFALDDSTGYSWRVRCSDGTYYSDWTELAQFMIILGGSLNNPPSQPVHASPTEGDTVLSIPMILIINNATDPEGDPVVYDFWTYADSSLNLLIETRFNVSETPGQTAASLTSQPVNGRKYWWRVRARDTYGASEPTSPTWFVFSDVPMGDDPYTATLVGPGDGDEVSTDQPVLAARNITAPGINYYYFEVALDSGFFSPVVSSPAVPEDNDGVTEWQVSTRLESGPTCYWRVQVNDYPYSRVSSFTVDYQIYASPNPVHFYRGEHVTFHLPEDAVDLLIQTVSGETVRIEKDVSGEWAWNGTNASGNQVAIGVYLWYVPGTPHKGKIVVKP